MDKRDQQRKWYKEKDDKTKIEYGYSLSTHYRKKMKEDSPEKYSEYLKKERRRKVTDKQARQIKEWTRKKEEVLDCSLRTYYRKIKNHQHSDVERRQSRRSYYKKKYGNYHEVLEVAYQLRRIIREHKKQD